MAEPGVAGGLLDPETSEQGLGGQAGCREDGAGGRRGDCAVRLGGRYLCSHPRGLGSQPQKTVQAHGSRAAGRQGSCSPGTWGTCPSCEAVRGQEACSD